MNTSVDTDDGASFRNTASNCFSVAYSYENPRFDFMTLKQSFMQNWRVDKPKDLSLPIVLLNLDAFIPVYKLLS